MLHSTEFGKTETGEARRPPAYNFGRSGQMSNDQINAIALVNEGIARRLTNTMGAWLRTQVQIALMDTEAMIYSEYLRVMSERAYIGVLRLEPLGGMALLEIEIPLVLAIIEMLLGGRGAASDGRDVTEIEESILEGVLAVVLRELNAAWEDVGLNFTIDRRETIINVAHLLQPAERTLAARFLMQVGELSGVLRLCVPAVVLNTVHRRLIAVKYQPQRKFEAGSQRVTELMASATMPAVLRLPSVRISSRVLQQLEPGYVLPLPLPRYTQAELRVRGVRIAAAIPVGRGEHRAALLQPVRAAIPPALEEQNSGGEAAIATQAGGQK